MNRDLHIYLQFLKLRNAYEALGLDFDWTFAEWREHKLSKTYD